MPFRGLGFLWPEGRAKRGSASRPPTLCFQRYTMTQLSTPTATPLVDRRDPDAIATPPGVERRQFANSHDGLSPAARELAVAIDEYKLYHRRRFITYEEMLMVIESLGYRRD